MGFRAVFYLLAKLFYGDGSSLIILTHL